MASTNELHVVLGTGPLGLSIMRELLKRGKRVRMVNRRGTANVPAEVQVVKADLYDPNSVKTVVQGASVVYQCSQPEYTEWQEKFPPLQAAIIDGVAASGTNAKLVVAENLYMYGLVNGKMTEETPFNAHTRKGKVRGQMANDLMAAHKAGKVRATAGRAADFYGPYAAEQGAFGDRVVYPMLAGKKVSGLGKIDLPHTYTFIDDYGKGLVVLGEHDEALGQAWHIPNAPTVTTREILTMFFEEAGLTPKIGSTPAFMVSALGLFVPVIREVAEMMYEFEKPFVVDHSKFVKAFGDISTPHREAVRATLAWFRQHPQPAKKAAHAA